MEGVPFKKDRLLGGTPVYQSAMWISPGSNRTATTARK